MPGLPVPRGDLLLALALSAAALLLDAGQLDGVSEQHHEGFSAGPATPSWSETFAIRESRPAGWTTLIVTAPLAFRRPWPLAVLAVQVVGVFTVVTNGALTIVGLVALLIGAATMAAAARRPMVALGILTAVAVALAASFAENAPNIPSSFAPFVLLLPVGLAGITLRSARLRAEAYRQRAEALAREQERVTEAALATERSRIARELHDVVSHHVSVITIQAGAAIDVLDSRPDLARGAMAAVEASGREAMGELRQLLGVLTPSEAEGGTGSAALGSQCGTGPIALEPQPGLAQLPGLVESVRAAGQPVRFDVPDGLALPVATGLTAYRVVQEALTNALRHAPGAETSVRVEMDGAELVIVVSNEAPAAASRGVAGAGTGLAGLAERLRLHGGVLEARQVTRGGFAVHARMPLS